MRQVLLRSLLLDKFALIARLELGYSASLRRGTDGILLVLGAAESGVTANG